MKKILSLLCICLFMLFSALKSSAENIKFVQITDVHLSNDSEYSQKVLKSAVEDINKQENISFVVFTGDNINSPKSENLKTFAQIVSKLKVPYYVAVGNHDVYKSKNMSKVEYYEILRAGHPLFFQRSANYIFKKKEFVFLIADGAKEVVPGSIGYYRQDTLDWLDDQLSKYKNRPVVIFQHFPVEYPEGGDSRIRTHKTYRVEDYHEILENHHNVLAIISGHFHVNSETMKDGIYHISTPSLIALPQSYKIIDIVTTKEFSPIIYTQLREFSIEE